MKQTNFTLANKILIPAIGFGTWQIPDGEVAYQSVLHALKAGYRHIDTAMAYKNEESVGRAIKDSLLKREEVFITTKLPAFIKGYEETIEAFHSSLARLGVEYIDLYLIHAPKPWGVEGDGMDYMEQNIASWKAFETLYKEKYIRSIGVSNFGPNHLTALMKETTIVPMVNQISVNPNAIPKENILFNQKHHILIEAYSPLATGRIFQTDRFDLIAQKYNKTVAQICIRWSYQMGFLPLPKSITPARIEENLNIFDFALSQEDMNFIGTL
ncbi:MAG: aldo/keto reductase [Bacilli bacterium]|nr:aldo/keto reductase [Bacilli bacterium]